MREEIRDAAQTFEGSLMILRKDKNGWVFGFSVHPSEAPSPLLDAPLGTRFQCVLFQIDDDESLIIPEEVRNAKIAVSDAGKLCRDQEFRAFVATKFYQFRPPEEMKINNPIDEEECAELLRKALRIKSRSELANNPEARDRFKQVVSEFYNRRWQ